MELEIRKNPKHWNSSYFFKLFQAWLQDFQITPEFIDDQSFNVFPHVVGQKLNCAVEACKNASPFDVPNKDYWSLRKPRSADIYNISFVEINLGSPSCSFHNNNVILFTKPFFRSFKDCIHLCDGII